MVREMAVAVVVSVHAFYSIDPSSNAAGVYSICTVKLLEKDEKRSGLAHFILTFTFRTYKYRSIPVKGKYLCVIGMPIETYFTVVRTYLFIEWAAWIMLKFSRLEPFALNILDPKNVDL